MSLTASYALIIYAIYFALTEAAVAYYYTKERGVAVPHQGVSRGLSAAVRSLEPGESVLLPTSAGSLVSLVGYLRRRGEAKTGEFTVRAEGERSARIWRLELK